MQDDQSASRKNSVLLNTAEVDRTRDDVGATEVKKLIIQTEPEDLDSWDDLEPIHLLSELGMLLEKWLGGREGHGGD